MDNAVDTGSVNKNLTISVGNDQVEVVVVCRIDEAAPIDESQSYLGVELDIKPSQVWLELLAEKVENGIDQIGVKSNIIIHIEGALSLHETASATDRNLR